MVNELIDSIKKLSKHKLGKQITLDVESLSNAMERRKLDKQFRDMDIDHLDVASHLANLESDEILKRALLAQIKCIVRVYFISAFDLASRDNSSPSDPYLYLQMNNKIINERWSYQLDEPNPDFYQCYDFEGTFPGCSPLQVDVWDYDDIFGDDLIGTTNVDLEDRYFSLEW